ncbi:hypothetical protein V8F20_012446 [Naviculisporaceae sp. PSN 640]
MAEYWVQSYHFNVQAGDSAIHLLCTNDSDDDMQILSAVLIDGGKGKGSNKGLLKEFLELKEFEDLKFDAVVVTHWDSDHYLGIYQLLEDDYIASGYDDDWKPSFFKFDDDDPQTRFYCPYFKKTKPKVNDLKSAYDKFTTDSTNTNLGITIDKAKFESIALLFDGQHIGTDFFNVIDKEPTAKQADGFKNPEQLVDWHSKLDWHKEHTGAPGLYCVAQNWKCIGGFSTPGALKEVRKVDEPEILDTVDSTPTNQSSLAAMLIWDDGQISLYTGGDRDDPREIPIVEWSGCTGGPELGKNVTTVKASHHGACTSSPTTFFEKFNPQNVIISSGADYGHPRWELIMYIEAWNRLNKAKLRGTKGEYREFDFPLVSTVFPYWLATDVNAKWVELPANKLSTSAIDDAKFESFQDAITSMYTEYNKIVAPTVKGKGKKRKAAEIDPLTEYENKAFTTRSAKLQWISSVIAPYWNKLSFTKPSSYPEMRSKGWVYDTLAQTVGRRPTSISWIQVNHTQPWYQDGDLWVRYDSGNEVLARQNSDNDDPTLLVSLPVAAAAEGMVGDDGDPFPIPQARARGVMPSAGSVQVSDQLYDDPNINIDEQSNPPPGSGIKPTPKPPPKYPAVDWDAGQYFYSARVQPGPSGAGVTAKECDTDSDFGFFLESLHTGFIGLSSTADAGGWYTVLEEGDLEDWFGIALGMSPGDMKATTDSPTIPTRLCDLQVTLSSVFTGGALVFNVTSVAAAFQGDISGIPGVIVDGKMTILGLDPRNAVQVTTTTDDLFKYIALKRSVKALGTMSLGLQSAQSAGRGNAIWFEPGTNYSTNIRTVWSVTSGIDQLNSLLKGFNLGVRVTEAEVIAFKGANWDSSATAVPSPSITSSGTNTATAAGPAVASPVRYSGSYATIALGVTIKTVQLQGYLKLGQFSTELTVVCGQGSPTLADLVDWVLDAFTGSSGGGKPSGDDVTTWLGRIGNAITPRQLSVSLDEKDSLAYCEVAFEVDLSVGRASGGGTGDGDVVASLFTFSWSANAGMTLGGSFFPSTTPPPFEKVLLPGYEDYMDLQPNATNAVSEIRLATLIPGVTIDEIPPNLDLAIKAASFSVSKDELSFQAVITTSDDAIPPNPAVPHLRLGLLSLGATYSTTAGASVRCSLSITLTGKVDDQGNASSQDAMLNGSLVYMKTAKAQKSIQRRRLTRETDVNASWQVSADIQDLQVGTLYELFDSDSQDGVLGLIGHIDIASLDLLYNYSSGSATDFTFTGVLLLGPFKLDLEYRYPSNKQWYFKASLKLDQGSGDQMTLQQLVTSLHNTGNGDPGVTLPSFVGNIVVSGGEVELDVLVSSSSIGETPTVFCVVDLKIADFQVLFVQFQEKGSTPKRLFRAAMTALPEVDNIPVIDKITQPFDEMYFLYAAVGTNTGAGVTRTELAAINAVLPANAPPLVVKDGKAKPQPTDILITPGAHFVVAVNKGNVPTAILDYAFNPDKESPTALAVTGAGGEADDESPPDDNSGKASLKKTIGPLTLNNIGLQYKDGNLGILLDATFKLGPIELELMGFSISVPLKGNLINNIITPTVGINGMAVSFNEPPTMVAGMFEELAPSLFAGGLAVSFDPYVFAAAGAYGTMSDASGNSYKTVAVFAKCQGPLIELEFAQLTGVCLGFGYNSHLTLPTVDNVTSFPLVGENTVVTPGQDALDIFNIFQVPPGGGPAWIFPQKDSIWFAAGLEITALSVLDMSAVVAIEFDPNVKLGIYADAVGQFPPQSSGDQFVYIELGIAGTVDFAAGSMVVQGKLAPTSFILDPNCHLTGGFALCYWFGANAHAGDWVFTLGGYHPAYTPPSHYPVPDRLAISWSLDEHLSITGDSYCAVTPKACMAGGALHVALSLGPLSASFSAWADFLLNFEPFWFEGDGGVSVRVEFTLDLWIVTIHIDVEIGASLHIQGPSVAGTVHVDFWVFGFDIDFGSSGTRPTQPLSLQEFYTHILLPQAGDNEGNQHTVTCKKGLVADRGKGDTETPPSGQSQWKVRGGDMVFGVKSVFAFTQATVTGGGQVTDTVDKVFSRPMQRGVDEPLDTTMTILVYNNGDEKKTPIDGFRVAEDAAELPSAVWGAYTSDTDPLQSGNQISELLNGDNPTVLLMNGVTVTAPKPYYSADVIPPFNVLISNIEQENKDHEYKQYNLLDASTRWNPAPPLSETDLDAQYTLVETKWLTPDLGADTAANAAALFAARLWARPGQVGPTLVGKPPVGLLEKKVFVLDYLAPPMVTSAVAVAVAA